MLCYKANFVKIIGNRPAWDKIEKLGLLEKYGTKVSNFVIYDISEDKIKEVYNFYLNNIKRTPRGSKKLAVR